MCRLHPELAVVLALCERAKAMSRGWFDPWAMPGGVDPTGLVKGWAIQEALRELLEGGIASALVNGGGDVAVCGTRPEDGAAWQVGVQHPWRPGSLACVVPVRRAIATSGCYERGAHLVNPRSGLRAAAVASATVCGPDLALADALATALAVGGLEVLEVVEALDDYEGYVIHHDGAEAWTPGMTFTDP